MAGKKRRLADLYVVGEEVKFDDGTGDPIRVFVKKLNPIDQEKALKRANAARSRVLSMKNFKDSEEYLTEWASVRELGRDQLIEYLCLDERARLNQVVEAEMASEGEWDDESYLEGIQQAWIDGLNDEYARDPEDPEASRVFKELERFSKLVDDRLDGEMEAFEADIDEKTEDTLREMVFDKILSLQGSIQWLNEYRRCEVWLSVREMDKTTRYFEDRSEVDDLPSQIFTKLSTTYQALSVDPIEGKE